MASLNVKIQIGHCSWNEICQGAIKTITSGTAKICQMDDTILILIGDVTYALKEGMPVVLQSMDDQMVFVFGSQNGDILYGLSTIISKGAREFEVMLRDLMLIEETTNEEKKEEKESSTKFKVYGNKLASVISKGGKLGLDVIDKGTEKTRIGIGALTEKAKRKIPRKEQPMQVSESTKAKIEKAKLASTMAVTVSASMLKGALEAANQMSDQMKPVLSEYLEKKGIKTDKPAGPKTDAAITVGKQSLKTALELYIAMKEASVVLLEAGLDASADLIEHRYGADAGAAARNVAEAGKNTIQATKNVGGLGIKQTAKKVITDTAIKSLESPEQARKIEEQKEAANALVEGLANASFQDELKVPGIGDREKSAAFAMD